MRTQIAKTAHLPAEYIPPTFWLVPPPPFPQVDGGGCYRENFFYFFWFFIVLVLIVALILVLYSFDYDLGLLHIVENYGFDIISRFNIPILYFDSFLLVEFYSHQFRLVSALQILRFDSSTLYLFNSSACYKQTSMLIWVCWMLILAILGLSDVFSCVLGVVYRLGIK